MAATLLPQPTLFSAALIVVNIVFPVLATAAVVLRFYARKGAGRYVFFADDWLILGTLFFCWANTANTLVGAAQIGVDMAKTDPLTQVKVTVRTLWTEGFLLATALALAKVAVLHLYYRIFATKCQSTFKFSVWSMYAILTGWWISSIVCQALATDPIHASYNPTIPFKYRFNYSTWSVCFAAMSLGFDVIILIFPVPVIGKLHMDLKRKISVIAIFWLGAFCCIAAAIRLYFLYIGIYKVTSSTTENPYRNVTAGFIWAHVEPNCSIIAACLPTYGRLFHSGRSGHTLVRSVRSIFSSSRSGTNSGLSKSGLSSKSGNVNTGGDSQHSLTGEGSESGYYELSEQSIDSRGIASSRLGKPRTRVLVEATRDVEAQRAWHEGGIGVTKEIRSERHMI